MLDNNSKNTEHDWLANTQNTTDAPQYQYNTKRRGIIRTMRIALLILVIIICGFVFYSLTNTNNTGTIELDAQNRLQEQKTITNEATENNMAKGEIAMTKAKYSGLDEKQQPFNITADKASRSSNTPDMINLTNPMADVLLQDNSWVAVYGENGNYMQEHMQLFLNGRVKLFHDAGYEILTDSLHIDLKKSAINSESDIIGHGPKGKIQAKGLEFSSSDNKIIFYGPAKLTLFLNTNETLIKQEQTP